METARQQLSLPWAVLIRAHFGIGKDQIKIVAGQSIQQIGQAVCVQALILAVAGLTTVLAALDQLIAVNPLWEHRPQGMQFTSARLSALQGFQSLMPAPWYRELWQNPIQETHLHQAARELGVPANTSQLLLELARPLQDSHFMMVSDWLDNTHHDHGIAILMRDNGLVERFRALPDNAEALLMEAFEGMGIELEQVENVTLSLLLSINGWWQSNRETISKSRSGSGNALLTYPIRQTLSANSQRRHPSRSQAREAECVDTGARSSKLNLKARLDNAWNSPAANFCMTTIGATTATFKPWT